MVEIIQMIKKYPNDVFFKIIGHKIYKIHNPFILNTTFICHRINQLQSLQNISNIFGVEIDIRDGLKVAHDPDEWGVHLNDYLLKYNHEIIIFNIKCERMEMECLKLIKKYNIKNYFFLDSNLPMIVYLNNYCDNQNIAARFSEFEPIEYFEKIKDLVSWVWVDCFNEFPLTTETYKKLSEKKICIVSPELHNKKENIQSYREILINSNIVPNAICCKYDNIIEWI